MAIVGQNTLLNQYTPTFFIKDLRHGQTLSYDSVRRAFTNTDGTSGGGGTGATSLSELSDVSGSVGNPLSLQNGQSLIFNNITDLWENRFVDYNTLLNRPTIPTNNSFSFVGLNDTDNTIIPNGFVRWNSTGTSLLYTTTIPSSSISGLSAVATTGDYNDLINKPTAGTGSVTSVSVVTGNGISGSVANPTTTPAITLQLGSITPSSVAATGTVTGSNLSGTNTGDQTIALSGDVIGSGTGTFTTSLATVNTTVGTFGGSTQVPVITVDAKGRITNISTSAIAAGGTVTSVAASGGTTGLTFTGSPITTSGTLTLSGTLGIANGGTGATTASGAIGALLPPQTGNAGRFLTTNGSTVSWAVISGTGTVTSVAASGSNGVTISGSPITTSGTITVGLGNITPTSVAATGSVTGSNISGTNTGDQTITLTGDVTGSGTSSFATSLSSTGVVANTYGSATTVPVFTVDAKGRISNVVNTPITGASSSNTEMVVFHYSSGGSGNLTAVDAIYSQTPGVTVTITDGVNSIATYSFTGKSTPPKSITTYGQIYSTNNFAIKDTTSLPNPIIAGGGTSTAPDIATGLFGASNIVTLQTRMSDTGASAGLGQRAWLVVIFGF